MADTDDIQVGTPEFWKAAGAQNERARLKPLLDALYERREARDGLVEDAMGNYDRWAAERYGRAEKAVRDAVRALEDSL